MKVKAVGGMVSLFDPSEAAYDRYAAAIAATEPLRASRDEQVRLRDGSGGGECWGTWVATGSSCIHPHRPGVVVGILPFAYSFPSCFRRRSNFIKPPPRATTAGNEGRPIPFPHVRK